MKRQKRLVSWFIEIILFFTVLIPLSANGSGTQEERVELGNKLADKGNTYTKQENYLAALAMFRQSYLLNPEDPMAPWVVGRAYMKLDECEKAHEYFSLTLVHHQSDKMPEEAKNIVLTFIATNPQCAMPGDARDVHRSRQLLAEGMELYLLEDMAGAIQKFTKSMEIAPNQEASLRLALTYSISGDCDALKASLEDADKLGDLSKLAGFIKFVEQQAVECFDPCDGLNCAGHGECVVQEDIARCECEQGYHAEGLICTADLNPCDGIGCSGYGKCIVQGVIAKCECEQGYLANGMECIADLDPCNEIVCSGHGKCIARGEFARCECEQGYHSEGLMCTADDVNPCDEIACSEHGKCVVQEEIAKCECEQGYHAEGLICAVDLDPCYGIICSGHGKCVAQEALISCECEQGYLANGTECDALPVEEDGVSPIAWVLGGTAVVSIVVSIIFAAHVNSLQSDLEKETALVRFNSDKAEEIWSDIETGENVFNVFLWSGVGLAATSVLLFVVTGGESENDEVSLGPILEPGLVGMGMNGKF